MKNCIEFFPVVGNSGFKMDDWYVWCSSVIKENGVYYLFAARWPQKNGFPLGYLTDSEIVLATSDDLSKPFEFQKVIISKRDGGYWDSVMAHNPFIFKVRDKYVLYYIGSPDGGTENRGIGYAYSDSLTDGWIRSDKAIVLPPDANNPAVIQTEDGNVLLYFRDGNLKVSVARAKSFDAPYEVLKYDILPKGAVEDMFVYKTDKGYYMLAEDCGGAYTGLAKSGVRFFSHDGVNWDSDSAVAAYDFDLKYDDGTELTLQRRERPVLFCDETGDGAKWGGPDKNSGGITCSMVQKIANMKY